ncbi:beta-ketoacyl-[acyl-carrier-protein] synthase family protein [Jatrophihabitans lederbergiae]|jgi:3-oxoacyl-[acyl-carrier-protein] synthase II|uniref:Beta-ketoacyl-[acyl-carrier-protein] synthase family protein n=1 Tax=Jatrophihabitans lederbergiae TaxID=3075547 RepID=A0ABU2JCK4_9ACTN|nr:beta-ketoacyl-[acyl-carrier-protein] synthase family protein [Jatrophihabitans sp. DSM 44399]MDT0262672.1 beta-ketoacyl-[acyl-carrier-protein] synthase family protein [Jatrophihabitans sp. DSM 44399]
MTETLTNTSDPVVVTGLGATTPLGGDVASYWSALLDGTSGVVALQQDWAADIAVRIAAPMAVDPAEILPRVKARRLDRAEQAALVAAAEAWKDAGFTGTSEENGLDPARVAVVIGTGIGGVTSLIFQHDVMLAKGAGKVSPLMIPMNMPNGPAAYVGLQVGARSGVHTPVSACASGAEAISYGLDLIQLGRADVVVVGGTEACVHPLTISGFAQMRAMSTRNDEPERASRPYDKGRDGFVLGEGAGILVLERLSSARARGREPYAVLGGAGITADSYDIVQPDPAGNGQARAARIAIERSGVALADVVHVNAHATSTPAGDMAEATWLADMLGEQTVVSATKSMTGHLLGASGAIEAIATVLSVANDVVPPTINLDDPEDGLAVDVPTKAREMTVTAALNDSFGFGGHNAALLFHKL